MIAKVNIYIGGRDDSLFQICIPTEFTERLVLKNEQLCFLMMFVHTWIIMLEVSDSQPVVEQESISDWMNDTRCPSKVLCH